jgi:hypothetical protein
MIREEMSREADYDVDLFTEMVRSGRMNGANVQGSKTRVIGDERWQISKNLFSHHPGHLSFITKLWM